MRLIHDGLCALVQDLGNTIRAVVVVVAGSIPFTIERFDYNGFFEVRSSAAFASVDVFTGADNSHLAIAPRSLASRIVRGRWAFAPDTGSSRSVSAKSKAIWSLPA